MLGWLGFFLGRGCVLGVDCECLVKDCFFVGLRLVEKCGVGGEWFFMGWSWGVGGGFCIVGFVVEFLKIVDFNVLDF